MKEFLPYDVVRNDALKLAHKILKDDFIPDVILNGFLQRIPAKCEKSRRM